MKILGIVLILLGVLALVLRRISYPTHRAVIRIGPVDTEVQTKKTIPLPPLFGALTVTGGVLLVLAARKK